MEGEGVCEKIIHNPPPQNLFEGNGVAFGKFTINNL